MMLFNSPGLCWIVKSWMLRGAGELEAICKNNDLWNLLSAQPDLNNKKRDKIPSPALIDRQSGLITHYWEVIDRHSGQRFRKEIASALLGYDNQVTGRLRRCGG